MKTSLMFPSNYIKADDLEKDFKLTIYKVAKEELTVAGGAKKVSMVVYFEETASSAKKNNRDEKAWVMNKTNMKIIKKLYGKDSDMWIGKQITLYATTCKFGRDTVDCIRVREK
jgi:hypothetical protein